MKKFEALRQQFSSGRISRREFIKRSTALGMAASVPGVLLHPNARAGMPKKGGHMRIATVQGSTTDSLDPALPTSGFTNFLFYTVHSQLTEVGVDGSIRPLLAESFEPAGDPAEWIFNIRKDVQFHTGKTVDSDDVVTSIGRHRGKASRSAMRSFAEQIDSIKKDGSHRVIIKLKTPSVDFPVVLSASTFGILPTKNGEVVDFNAGTGGYAIESFEPGISATFKRNPNYYMTDRAFVDSAELLTIADTAARQNALATEAVDIIGDIEFNTAELLGNRPGITVLDVTGTQHYSFPMRTDLAPFSNYHVRMALKLSIDRNEVLHKVLRGHGTLGNDHPISPANRYHHSELPQRPYDPDKARWHLKQVGMENLEVSLSASDGLYTGALDTVVLYSEHAKKSGIAMEPARVPDDGYWSDVWLKHPWCASYWSGRPTEDWMFTQGYAADSNWNESFWKNDQFNQLLVAARAELDDAKRRLMYQDMQELVHNDGGSVIHLFANHISAYSDKVGKPEKVAGNWEFDGYKQFERWWMV